MIKKLLFLPMLTFGFYGFSQQIVFQETFDTVDSQNAWINTDRDGDGEKWEFYNAEENQMPAFSGDFATSWSWFLEAFTPDNTLTSPVFSLPATQDLLWLKFKVGAYDEEIFEEHYAVYVIPANSEFTGNETPVFEETLDAGYTQTAKNVMVDITQYQGQDVQLVFRHYNCTDVLFIGLDDVEVILAPGLAVSDYNKLNFKVYPNPTSDVLRIEGKKNIEKVRIFDMSGKMVKEIKNSEIDVRDLKSGQYLINVYSGKDVVTQKFIKK